MTRCEIEQPVSLTVKRTIQERIANEIGIVVKETPIQVFRSKYHNVQGGICTVVPNVVGHVTLNMIRQDV